MNFSKPLDGYRIIQTRVGDSLPRIAARELGDASQWYVLANINNLHPPFLTDDPGLVTEFVKRAGTDIIGPGSIAPGVGQLSEDALFGADVALESGYLTAESGDLSLRTGLANLKQSLQHRIATRIGDLLYYPQYGCGVWDLLGQNQSPSLAMVAQGLVQRAVLSDKRVISTSKVSVSFSGDTLNVDLTVMTLSGAVIELEVLDGLPA